MDYDVVVVGGGAAGLMAAVTATERGRRVLLLEKMDQAGRKLRITGKGRCNLTNTNTLRDTLPHIGSSTSGATNKPGQTGGVWLRNVYGRFFNQELMDFFEECGVPLVVERGNRVYPASGKALDVFLALIGVLENNPNVTIRKNATVKAVETFENKATAVILEKKNRNGMAFGIGAYEQNIRPTDAPQTGTSPVRGVDAVKAANAAALGDAREGQVVTGEVTGMNGKNVQLTLSTPDSQLSTHFGEMTFTSDGLAGPIVLSASRVVTRLLNSSNSPFSISATLDLKPALTPEQLDKRLQADLNANGTRIFNDALRLWLPAELIVLALPPPSDYR